MGDGVTRSFLYACLALTVTGQVLAAEPIAYYSRGSAACTPKEVWRFSSKIPVAWKKQFEQPPTDRESALKRYVWAYALKKSAKVPEAIALADYGMARALYQLDLVHLAFQGFEGVAVGSPLTETDAIKVAAIECIQKIRMRYPSFAAPSFRLANGNRQWGRAVRKLALANIRQSQTQIRAQTEIMTAYFQPGSAQENFVKALRSSAEEMDADAVKAAEAAVRAPNVVELSAEEQDALQIILARSHYNLREYDQAIAAFKGIKRSSSYFAQSYSDMAWAYLLRGKYNEALSAAYNLLVGGMSHGFSPEAPVIAAIAYFETCNYQDAVKALRVFKKTYLPVYQWLNAWGIKPEAQKPSLYQLAVSFLQKKPEATMASISGISSGISGLPPLPGRVASEWVGSPVFISHQQELNLLLDEKPVALKWVSDLNRRLATVKDSRRPAYTLLRDSVISFTKNIDLIQRKLIASIEQDLTERNRDLLAQITDVGENSQLVEVEIMNAVGADIIEENARPEVKARAAQLAKSRGRHSNDGPVLDWGRFPSGEASDDVKSVENAEIWEDEVGSLRSDVMNICPKR